MSDGFNVEDVLHFVRRTGVVHFVERVFIIYAIDKKETTIIYLTLYVLQVIADVRWCRELMCNGGQRHTTVEDIIIEDNFDLKHFLVIFSEVGRSVEMPVGNI